MRYLMNAGTPEPRVMIGQVQGAQTAALKPPPNSGTFPPTAIGMTPEIGPPLAAEAGVSSVWLAPALAGAGVHLSGVMPLYVRGRGGGRDEHKCRHGESSADHQAKF